MSKLLHSKTFRKNLYKWLFMYICALLVISTVVTYSRYITKNSLGDEARAAKFDIQITQDKVCLTKDEYNIDDELLCTIIKDDNNNYKIKPYDTLEYYFTVDSSELEVLSKNMMYINYDNTKYTIKILYKNNSSDEWSEKSAPNDIITTEEGANLGKKTNYKIILKPTKKTLDGTLASPENIVGISYIIEQKTN